MSKPFKFFSILAIGKRLLGLVLYLQCNEDWLNFFYIVKRFYCTDSFFSLLGARVGMKGFLKLNCTRSCWNTSAADNERRQILQCLSPKSPWVLDLFWVFFSFPVFPPFDLRDIGNTQWTLHHQCNSTDFAAVGGMLI